MKFILVIFLTFALAACGRNEVEPREKDLAGQWEWVQSQGGIAGMTYKASENDQRQLIFSAEGDYESIQNGKSIIRNKYRVKDSVSINFSGVVPMIHIMSNSVTYQQQAFTLKKNELVLFDEYNDGFTHTYRRIR